MREEKVSPQSGPIMPYTLTSGPVLLIAAIVVASFIFALYGKYQSRPKTWTVVGCSIVKDDRVARRRKRSAKTERPDVHRGTRICHRVCDSYWH